MSLIKNIEPMKVNINSANFPLSTSRKYDLSRQDNPISSVKIYSEIKNTNNKEFPNYFKLDLLNENPQTKKSKHILELVPYDSKLNNPKLTVDTLKSIDNLKFKEKRIRDNQVIQNFSDIDFNEKRTRLNNYKPCVEMYPNDYLATVIEADLNNKIKCTSFKLKNSIKDVANSNKSEKENARYNTLKNDDSCPSKTNLILPSLREFNEKGVFDFHPKRSAYLRNYNDYNIKEADNLIEENVVKFNKNSVVNYNCVKDETKLINPDIFIKPTFSKFKKK